MTDSAGVARPGSVLVVGDANVDLVLRGDVVPRFGQAEQLLDAAELVLGGSASIVACGLARLGVPTALAAVVGDDEFGRFTRAALQSAGVRTDAVTTSATAPTGISVILSAPADRGILTLPGTIPLLSAADVREAVAEIRPAWVHLASPFLIPGLTAELPALLADLRTAGIGVSLDTNWDPAEAWAGISELLPSVDVLLPNAAELAALAGVAEPARTTDDPRTQAAVLAAVGPRVVVKDGAAGGWSLDASGTYARGPGLDMREHGGVVDTTGAGDSFDAGYLAALAHGVSDESDRLRWAAAAGSLSVRAAGGTGGQADLAELRSAVSG